MKESAIVRKIILGVKERYPRSWVRKISDRYTRGLADILMLVPCAPPPAYGSEWTLFLAVECKTPTGRPAMLQRQEGEEINRLTGAIWMVAKDLDSVLDVLRRHGAIS